MGGISGAANSGQSRATNEYPVANAVQENGNQDIRVATAVDPASPPLNAPPAQRRASHYGYMTRTRIKVWCTKENLIRLENDIRFRLHKAVIHFVSKRAEDLLGKIRGNIGSMDCSVKEARKLITKLAEEFEVCLNDLDRHLNEYNDLEKGDIYNGFNDVMRDWDNKLTEATIQYEETHDPDTLKRSGLKKDLCHVMITAFTRAAAKFNPDDSAMAFAHKK